MPKPLLDKLSTAQSLQSSVLCVGLDPDLDRIPAHLTSELDPADAILRFNREIIDATSRFACAFKVNFGFYEALGSAGWRILGETVRAIPDSCVTIADAKRGDIGNTARFYARSVFEHLGFDACTLAPYMGFESIAPFLEYENRGVFLLARTSNAGSDDIQMWPQPARPLYLHVTDLARRWNEEAAGTVGLVAGATDVQALERIRCRAPELPLLIPGIGAQGGDPERVGRAAHCAGAPFLINSSRSILYASTERDFAEAAAAAAQSARDLFAGIGERGDA
jgi:orotidine-5'-phosphate decarboxylase